MFPESTFLLGRLGRCGCTGNLPIHATHVISVRLRSLPLNNSNPLELPIVLASSCSSLVTRTMLATNSGAQFGRAQATGRALRLAQPAVSDKPPRGFWCKHHRDDKRDRPEPYDTSVSGIHDRLLERKTGRTLGHVGNAERLEFIVSASVAEYESPRKHPHKSSGSC